MATYMATIGEGDEVEFRISPLTGYSLFYEGQKLKRGFFSSKFKLTGKNEKAYEIQLRQNWVDSLPKMVVNGQEIQYAPPLPGWAKLISIAALAEMIVSWLIIGGFIGVLAGALALYFGQNAMRSTTDTSRGALMGLGIVALGWAVWVVLIVGIVALYAVNG